MEGRSTAVVIGAGGGIGNALVDVLVASGKYKRIHALSRRPQPVRAGVFNGTMDVTDEVSIARAVGALEEGPELVVVATGMLHHVDQMPEKALRDLNGPRLARLFEVNTIGPALVLKHFAPVLPRDTRSVIAVLSARVGSISDNRSGGWYGYRASKAALNMIVKTAAIEIARSRPKAICVALHPGTVDTPLSRPFQRGVPADKLFTPERAARQLLSVIDGLGQDQSGELLSWDASAINP